MKTISTILLPKLYFAIFLCIFMLAAWNTGAQVPCEVTKFHGQGYSSKIASVTDNGNNSYTIVLVVEHDGCPGPGCKKMNSYSVEADPGTYSNIVVQVLSGSFTYANLSLGPNLGGGTPFQGFRINNANGMGNGQQASFSITYTLTGGLQDQQTLVKASSDDLLVSFSVADFLSVLNCEDDNIFPYYAPPENGKAFDLIGAELTSLYNVYSTTGTYFTDDIFQIVGSSVKIEIGTQPGQYSAALTLLTSSGYGLTNAQGIPGQNKISGLLPILNLLSLNQLPNLLVYASPIYTGIRNSGIVTSQGDTSLRTYLARTGFDLDGAGIKVGVLSDSYNTLIGNPAGDDILRGDLPGATNPDYSTPVHVLLDYPYGIRSDEGRAMLQIVHDIAPGAELAFRTGFLGAVDFSKGIQELQQAGCDVIVDDITYISEPFFRDGIVAQAVDVVTAQGVSYFSSAGNYGSKSYESAFSPVAAPSGITGQAHNFAASSGGTDIYQSITLEPGNYTVVLQWDDGTPGTNTSSDFDIYLSRENGTTLFGFNRVNTGGAPLEVLPFTVVGDNASSNFLIVRSAGTAPATLKYIIFRGNILVNEYFGTGSSTLVGQANAAGAMAVGAVLYSNTPEFGVNPPTPASFSSRGGTAVSGTNRNKPEFTAPNGVNTTVDLGGVNIDGDLFPNFFGTSAAAPHAAAVAALILQAREKYYNTGYSPAQVKSLLQSSSIDMGTPGYDAASGSGFIQADAALGSIANPRPLITGISYDTTLVPGIDTLVITVYGEFLTDMSEIWFNGQPLANATILIGDSIASSTILPFEERYPAIQVYNPPMAGTNGLDGGLSDPIYFSTKETIVVDIDDKTKLYGQVLPEFTATYRVESINGSVTLESAGLTPEEIARIQSVALTTIATPLSNTGIWAIEPESSDPLNPESSVAATDSLDLSLLERYNLDFETGFLSIEKIDVTISPWDTTFTYGDEIGGFNYDFDFGSSLLVGESDSLALLSVLKLGYATALVNETVLVDATAFVDALGQPILDASALMNKSFMISNALKLGYATALVNGTLIEAEPLYNATALTNTITRNGATALAPATALVNGEVIVNTLDSTGALVNAVSLGRATALVNAMATALVNTSTINANSNSDAIVILGDGDIKILSGDSTGLVDLRSINLITGKTVGQHLIVPGSFISNNVNVSYGLGELTIVPDTAEVIIDASSLSQIYNGSAKTVTVSTIPEGLEVEITYDSLTQAPVNAGSYSVQAIVTDPNYVGEASATLVIGQAPATVTANTTFIYAGNPLPSFTATFSGFLNGDNQSVVTSLTFSVSPTYTGAAGTYQVIPSATALNYVFTPVNGTLYVNPFGPGTKQIKPKLTCVEVLNPPDSNGFTFLARYAYENDNATAVYIPKGPDNNFSGQATYNAINQPEVFLPGGGSFTVPFNGAKLIWTVASFRQNGQKSSVASQASSTSSRCNKSTEADEIPVETTGQGFALYPNPTTGKITVVLDEGNPQVDDIRVYDVYGKQIDVSAGAMGGSQFELDLTGLPAGMYFIRISEEEIGIKVSRVIKK